ncbi:hypothetical protein SprV_0401559200 [Sparganum proliferum]
MTDALPSHFRRLLSPHRIAKLIRSSVSLYDGTSRGPSQQLPTALRSPRVARSIRFHPQVLYLTRRTCNFRSRFAKRLMSSKLYDVVIFGATGYTGTVVVEQLAQYCATVSNLTWAVAGRSDTKLEKLLANVADSLGLDFVRRIPRVLASIENPESLLKMAKEARIVLNCVGPYALYGEEVVTACLDGEAHHLDISGEPVFLESIQLNFNEKAKDKGVFVIGACGFDSIPSEVGVQYTVENFPGEVTEIESIFRFFGEIGKIHFGTWESAVNSFGQRSEVAEIRKKLYPHPLPPPVHRQKSRGMLSFDNTVSAWCMPFLGCDQSVVYRSQRYLHSKREIANPVQFKPYFGVASLFTALLVLFMGAILGFLAKFEKMRPCLLKYPGLFTFGLVSHEGSTRQQLKDSSFEATFIAKGYARTSDRSAPPDKKLITRIRGPNAGYITCAICVVQAAVTLLHELDKMPNEGGVYSPGAAFWKTSYLKRLQESGIVFETVSPAQDEQASKKSD